MKRNSSPFKWRYYPPEVILLCIRWCCRFQLSYRAVEEMKRERGLAVDHPTIFRWVQRYAPEINKRMRPHLKLAGASCRIDETYVRVGRSRKYLHRALGKERSTIEFMPSAKRDVSAAKRFFEKVMQAGQCFRTFHTAERTSEGVEAMHISHKGRGKRLDTRNAMGQAEFVASLFGVAA